MGSLSCTSVDRGIGYKYTLGFNLRKLELVFFLFALLVLYRHCGAVSYFMVY